MSFRYAPEEPWVIKDCSFEVKAGQSVVIAGPSGCGKSTLIRLMLGLLDPLQGNILIGGVNLKQLGKRTWRGMVGSVMQDDTLFAGSIADNISFHDESATQERIEIAARLAQIHDDIIAMPMGYHSLVGDMGSALSGGQRQRVFLARALYNQPKVMVLDEAFSQIDVACERAIRDALEHQAITLIQISHRFETIAKAARVLIMRAGTLENREMATSQQQPELQSAHV